MDTPIKDTKIPWARWIGEFVVIAMGVAIGFQVDRSYEQRQNNVTASRYIERLSEDIQRDIENFNGGVASATARMASLQRVVQSVTSDAIVRDNPTRYMFDLRQGFMRYIPVPSDSTYQELVSTGNMALLPVVLRKSLHDYYSEIATFGQFLSGYESIQMEAYKRFAGILPPENFGMLSGVIEADEVSYTAEKALAAANRLRTSQAAVDWLYQMGELKMQEISISERYLDGARSILAVLEQ